ncbi:peptidoglycan glycosyltransferase [Litorimonas cladophorae]|uniref:Peptidoglycan glycosyltransferase n=1 Tax=Litorimonas cladophorae TaxID=1220491 RepID=A0A918KEM4_9PROT|nr:penicillin-binding protein 2 [Litorimonas cladophorae]GGX60557.1 peptidoglycan glycosyltransferase [Litorimonas cladophorae]
MSSLTNQNQNDKAKVTRRTAILGAGGLGVFGVLAARLYQLQVLQAEDYRTLSENNRFNFNMLLPERGEIRDRFGRALAKNRQNFRLVMIPERTPEIALTLDRVAEISPLSDRQRDRILRDIQQNPKFIPILIEDNMDWKTFSALNMRLHDLPGVVSEAGQGRAYPENGVFSHVLGYIGRAGDRDIESDPDPLLRQPTFRIGKTGVEASQEKTLRGASGQLKVEVNAKGRIVREWPDPKTRAVPGKDVWLTLDADLQEFAAKQFATEDEGDDSGGICVIDVITGELRTMLSMPTFDANLFVSGLTQADMDQLNNDPKRPQYNKAIAGGYPPASTFKMTVMLAALESGLIDPTDAVFCGGKIRLGNRNFHCWKRQGHGKMDMRDALKHSCDTYFYDISQVIGIEAIANVARRLGLGEKYQIGVGGGISGIVPDAQWKQDRLGTGWRMGDTLNSSIGQGFVLATPLQLAVMTARIANAQTAVMPQLIIGQEMEPFKSLDFDPAHIAYVRDAMWSVTSEPGGTAYRNRPFAEDSGLDGVQMAGKTGTGQVRGISMTERTSGIRHNSKLPWKLRDHSIFVGYAPFDNPKFAVGTIVEHGGSGAKRAADITRAVLGEALRRDGVGSGPKSEQGALR